MSDLPTPDAPARDRPSRRPPRRLAQVALVTSLLYGGAAAAYILLSDRAVETLIADPVAAARIQTYKGWAFVGVTALLLYFGLRGQFQRWEREVVERRRAEEALRTRVTQMQAILAHQPIAFFASDVDGRCTLWEGRTWPEAGFPPADIVGRPLLELAGDQPAAQVAIGRAAQGEAMATELRVQARTFEIFQSPLGDAAGRRRGVSGVVVDVTERKKLEAQLLRAQRLESVGRLAGGVAHDLNNILSPILISASLLRPKAHDANALGLLELIETSARRGAGIIRQLLTFSRGAAGEIAPVALQPLVADMRNLIRETFPKNIGVHVDVPAEPLMVRGDATQLHQVLMNLCVNARDAMPEGGTLTVTLTSAEVDDALARQNPGAQSGPFVVVRVRDTGTGIAPEHLDHIFDPFFTTKELGRGTGLGLSTALGIVKSHGGFIQLETARGAGTQFSIFLPRSEAPESAPDTRPAPAVQSGKGECILIVDDETSVRRVLRQALESAAYRVIEAEDGAAGLARFRAQPTGVRMIITDVMMPNMDAVSFVRAVRESSAQLPIISISGVDRTMKLDELKALGVSAFLRKPFALDALLETVQRHLAAGADRSA